MDNFQKLTLTSSVRAAKIARKVQFNGMVAVILIPTREEFRQAKLADVLSWQQDEYHEFKLQAAQEVLGLMAEKNMTARDAIRELYQPEEPLQSAQNLNQCNPINTTETNIQSCKLKKETEEVVRTNSTNTNTISAQTNDLTHPRQKTNARAFRNANAHSVINTSKMSFFKFEEESVDNESSMPKLDEVCIIQ